MAPHSHDVLGTQLTFEQANPDDRPASTIQRQRPRRNGARLPGDMYSAQQNGIYDEDWSHTTPTRTSFRTWCETVLAPAARDVS